MAEPLTQEKVLQAIKEGCNTRKEIMEKTGLGFGQVHNALPKLRRWSLIKTNGEGYWSLVNEQSIPHSIDCKCKECKEIRSILRQADQQGDIHLVGLPEDLAKIRKGD